MIQGLDHSFPPVVIVGAGGLSGGAAVGETARLEALPRVGDGGGSSDDDLDMADAFDVAPQGPPQQPEDEPWSDAEGIADELARALGLEAGDAGDDEAKEVWEMLRVGGTGVPDDSPRRSASGASAQPPADDDSDDGAGGDPAAEVAAEPFVVDAPPDEFAARVGVRPTQGWSYTHEASGQRVGFIRALPSGASLKAYCSIPGHGQCSNFVRIEHSYGHTTAFLIAWLAEGRQFQTSAEHRRHIPDLRALWSRVG